MHETNASNDRLRDTSVVILEHELFVTNLALPLTPTVGDEPEEDVRRYTISRLRVPEH